MTYISLDYETHDPTLKDKGKDKGKVKARGTSCVFGLGRVIVAGFYDGTRKWSIDGEGGDYVRSLLLSPDVTIIGANIQYDAVWAVTSLKLDPKDVRCRYIDVSVAESLIDEYQKYDLDSLAWKYLKERKGKSVLEDICAAKGLKGDFRGHLAVLWDEGYRQEIRDYVMSDADQPWRIWEQQKRIIESEGLMKAFQMNMDMLRVTVFMKVRGVRFDLDRWRANCRTAGDVYGRLRDEYEGKYGQVNINSSKQLAAQMDRFGVPYKCKLTFKGWKPEGRKFTKEDLFEGNELTRQKNTLREIFNGVTREKDKIVLYVPKRYASRTWEQATAMGYEVLCNPCVNKAMFTELSETHPIVADLAQYKQAKNIVDKFLGPAFGRFIVAHYADGTAGPAFGDDGAFLGEGAAEYRIHSTYNVVGARQTGRMSSSQCNNQQIPSKTVLFAKTDHELDLARLCRECFVAAPRHALVKQDYCLSLDSLFLTTEGYMRGDRLMEKARQLVSLDRKAQGYRAYVQERDMIAFELSNGVILKQIPEHRHYATDRKESYVKLAKDFKVGDQLAFYKDFIGPDSHEDDAAGLLGYACGLYLGDGYIRDGGSSGEIILHKGNLDFVKEQQGVFTGSLRRTGDIWHAGMRAEFCRWLLDQGFGRKDGKTIPDWMFSSPAVFRAGLIAGLLDTDAFVEKGRCVITMCREPLMRGIAELLACAGIYAVWTEQHVPAEKNNFGREHTNYNLYIRYMPPEMYRKIFYFMRVRTCAMACWHSAVTMKNLSWRFDYDSLPDDMFVQRRGAEYKSLYMSRYFRRGVPADTAAALGFWQKDKFPVTIRKIYPVRGEALIMECDTHSFVTANMPTMNCAQENRLAAYFAPGPNGERIRQMYRDNPFLDEHSYVTEVSGLAEQYGAKAGRKFAKNLRFGVCLSSDSLYATADGVCSGKELVGGGKPLLGLDGHAQGYTAHLFHSDGLEFELSNGVKFVSTPGHLFLDCESVDEKVKSAVEMRVGDRVPLARTTPSAAGGTRFFEDTPFDSGFAYLAGLYLGDGYIPAGVSLITHKKNTKFVTGLLDSYRLDWSIRHEKVVDRVYIKKTGNAGVVSFFRLFGEGCDNKLVPDFVYTASREEQLWFLAGLIDSDGCITDYSARIMGCNERLIRGAARLCAVMGMNCRFGVCRHKDAGKKDEFVLDIHDTAGLRIPTVHRTGCWKQNPDYLGWTIPASQLERFRTPGLYRTNVRLYDFLRGKNGLYAHNSWLPDGVWQKRYAPVEIVAIRYVPDAEFTYLTTDSHYYIANGFATHNCYGMQTPRMMIQFGWDKEFAEDLYDKVASAAPWLFELMDKVQETVLRRRYITTLAGRRVHMRRGHDKDAYKYMNYLIQGSAADMTKTATNAVYDGMLAEYDRNGSSPDEIVLSVHDEDDFDVDCTDVENAVARIMEIRRSMEDTSGCDLPIVSCPEIGTSWADGIEWDPSLGDCEDFVRRVCTAIRDGRFGELREQVKAWQHREEDDGMSFSEFCAQVDEDEDDDEAVIF